MSDNGEKLIAGMTRAERDALIAKSKAKEEAKVAAMSPEELSEYKAKKEAEVAYQDYLAQPAPITRGDLMEQEDAFEVAYDEIASDRDYIKEKADKATASQGGTDRALTKALARIKELEAERDELLKRLLAATGAEVVA